MAKSTIDALFEDIERYESEIKKKNPKQKGRVILANLKTDVDYEVGKPSDNSEQIKWCRVYVDKMRRYLK